MRFDMLKSNYSIKIGFRVLKPRSLRRGFLLIELMMAIFIGLVLISALMRMQSLLLELQDSFYMRDKALSLVVECLECDNLDKSGDYLYNGRNFTFNVTQNSLNKDALISKVKVEWQSLVGKKCCLEI